MPGTEDNNPYSREIQSWSVLDTVRFIHETDRDAFKAVEKAIPQISKAVEESISRLKQGGRIIYVGAGTSGRLAVQDVAELRPTYGIGESVFDYVMAGGPDAILKSVEDAEDSKLDSVAMLKEKNLNKNDVVFGITASGTTPFVLAALDYANSVGALSMVMTNNDGRLAQESARMCIVLETGPEVIQGSTRMKAGTSQKMVLTIFSTTVAVKLGYTYRNTMSNMSAWYNEKLRKRAIRMVMDEFGIPAEAAKKLLEDNSFRISEVFKILGRQKIERCK